MKTNRPGTRTWLATAIAAGAIVASSPASAQDDPWRLNEAFALPEWLSVSGEVRARYETLDGQFRAGGTGGDQILAFRTLVLAEADTGPVSVGLEVQDSRASLDDRGTPLSTGIVNPLDVLQAYVQFDADGAFGFKTASVKIGRQTLSLGSQRVLERVDMANVIFSYTGVYMRAVNVTGDELHVVAYVPTGRNPGDRASLAIDAVSGDEEQWNRRAWGVHWRERDLFGAPGLWGEVFVHGLDEHDARSVATPNRRYVQPGARLFRAPKAGAWDLDVETSLRRGTRRATSAASDTRDLTVRAAMVYAHLGYTFDHPWRPRVVIDHYWSSGDSDPSDGRYEQFERLFGSRRTDLGNTGIHGPLTSANIDAPGLRVEIAPGSRLDARLAWKLARLDQARDAWIDARLSDPTGQSGRFIGHAFDARMRWRIAPDSLVLEAGASALLPGSFARRVPNGPRPDRTLFGYLQLTRTF